MRGINLWLPVETGLNVQEKGLLTWSPQYSLPIQNIIKVCISAIWDGSSRERKDICCFCSVVVKFGERQEGNRPDIYTSAPMMCIKLFNTQWHHWQLMWIWMDLICVILFNFYLLIIHCHFSTLSVFEHLQKRQIKCVIICVIILSLNILICSLHAVQYLLNCRRWIKYI